MIKNLTLQNFKCFLKESIDFSSLTLFSGINGAGKSTIIQLLLLLRQSHLQGRLEKGLSLQGDLLHVGRAKDALNEIANNDIISANIKWGNDINAAWTFNASEDSDFLPIITSENNPDQETIYRTSLFSKGFNYISAERVGPRAVNQKDDYIVNEYKSVGMAGEFTANFLSAYGNNEIPNDLRYHEKAISRTLKANTEAWLNEISNKIRINPEEYLGTDQVRLTFSYETPSGSSSGYRATNVGFGLSYVLPIIVTVLSANPGDLIIIDTPEAHLHPRGQSKIGELLARAAKSGVQVIIETHSDHVLNGVRLAIYDDIIRAQETIFYYLSRELKQDELITEVHRLNIDASGRFEYWPSGFFDEWNINLQRLLYPKAK